MSNLVAANRIRGMTRRGHTPHEISAELGCRVSYVNEVLRRRPPPIRWPSMASLVTVKDPEAYMREKNVRYGP